VTTLSEFVDIAHSLWPLEGAEEWDSSGLVVGDPSQQINSVLLAVDAVSDTVTEAIDVQADLLLTHHPLLLKPIQSVSEERYKGSLLSGLIRNNIALLASHTNADVVENGVSDVIAKAMGLIDIAPITAGKNPGTGIGRVGNLSRPISLGDLAQQLAKILPHTAGGVKVSGDYAHPITRVALCGGAGDSLLSEPHVVSADVFITSDLRHHPSQEAREQARISGGPALIDVSHWASEWLWLETAASQLQALLPDVRFSVSELRTDPWDFLVVQ